jgi:hypothetical protein
MIVDTMIFVVFYVKNLGKGRPMPALRFFKPFVVILSILCLIGCSSFGTKTLGRERRAYDFEISRSDNSQLLLNIVRLHNLDDIDFLQITSITSQKTFTGSGSGSFLLYRPSIGAGATWTPSLSYSDSPTVTYTPLQGATFVNNLLTDVSLQSIFRLSNTDRDIEKIFMLALRRINDYHNLIGFENTDAQAKIPHGYDVFLKILHHLYVLQKENALEFYLGATGGEPKLIIIFSSKRGLKTQVALKRLLNVPPHAKFIELVTDYLEHPSPYTVRVKTRSFTSMLSYLANGVELPNNGSGKARFKIFPVPILKIYRTRSPIYTQISTYYRGFYYYIDDKDSESKRTFLLVSSFYQLSAGLPGGNSGVVLTLPLGK